MKESLTNALSNIVTFLPKLLAFILILLIGWFIAKLIAKAISKLLTKAGFDRAVERGGVKKALAKSEFDASDIVAKRRPLGCDQSPVTSVSASWVSFASLSWSISSFASGHARPELGSAQRSDALGGHPRNRVDRRC